MENISQSIQAIKQRIEIAAKKSNRQSSMIKLMAVSKFHPSNQIIEAINSGLNLFGENHVQEAISKFPDIITNFPSTELHMIGSLQRNKVKQIVKIASCIESVDRVELILEIEKQCAKIQKQIKILFEVHTGEESKSGFQSIDDLKNAIDTICDREKFSHIIPAGFMTMAPLTDNKQEIHFSFAKLREIANEMKTLYKQFDLSELSMGMSNDFEIAIEEGSTLIRVGSAIFGPRVY